MRSYLIDPVLYSKRGIWGDHFTVPYSWVIYDTMSARGYGGIKTAIPKLVSYVMLVRLRYRVTIIMHVGLEPGHSPDPNGCTCTLIGAFVSVHGSAHENIVKPAKTCGHRFSALSPTVHPPSGTSPLSCAETTVNSQRLRVQAQLSLGWFVVIIALGGKTRITIALQWPSVSGLSGMTCSSSGRSSYKENMLIHVALADDFERRQNSD